MVNGLVGVVLLLISGATVAQTESGYYTSRGGAGCTRQAACESSSYESNRVSRQCTSEPYPYPYYDEYTYWTFHWEGPDANSGTCYYDSTMHSRCNVETTTANVGTLAVSGTECSQICNDGESYTGSAADVYDACTPMGCEIASAVSCDSTGQNCTGTQTGLTCVDTPYPNGCPDDDDCDGYPNLTDECPSEWSDRASGCPLGTDDDADGVPNTDDQCPGSIGVVDERGCDSSQCPDTDGDGVMCNDACPNTPPGTIVESNGCPFFDEDGDGVRDQLDECPGTPAGTVVQADGCPFTDSDGDGVQDGQDQCPGTPAGSVVESNGCRPSETPNASPAPSPSPSPAPSGPDADGDGVPDSNDLCANTTGTAVNSSGCAAGQTPTGTGGGIFGSTADGDGKDDGEQLANCMRSGECFGSSNSPDLEGEQGFGASTSAMMDRIAASPFMQAAAQFGASFPTGGTCPAPTFSAFDASFTMDFHCDIWPQISGALYYVFLAVWVLLAFGIVMSA